jgi:hypothetical protein
MYIWYGLENISWKVTESRRANKVLTLFPGRNFVLCTNKHVGKVCRVILCSFRYTMLFFVLIPLIFIDTLYVKFKVQT